MGDSVVARVSRAWAVLVFGFAALVVPVGAATSAASAAASSTSRCTVVGTSHSDRLVGTRHRDVICGLGGNDVLIGRDGNDILRGGGGRDNLDGGTGADIVEGGAGADRLAGGDGSDRLLGGLANDVAVGGAGRDVLSGGDGNDDLTGGPNADDIRGGAGTNWCTLDDADTSAHCVYDRAPAGADRMSLSTGAVDVTAAAREVTVRVHVTDDTGVTNVRVTSGPDSDSFPSSPAELRSGDIRNGWWEATVLFPRYSMPGTYTPRVVAWDRVGRRNTIDFPDASIQVRDDTPDVDLPSVTLLSPTPAATYDVRNQFASFTVRARIVDKLSGAADVALGAWQPRANGALIAGTGGGMRLVSGTIRDGIWAGTITLTQGSVGGDWSLTISATDLAHRDAGRRIEWWGPGEYVYRSYEPVLNRPFPNNMGSVTVIGRARTDVTAPLVSSVQVTPTQVDTLPGPADVHLIVQASDSGLGVQGVYVELVPLANDGSAPQMPDQSLQLTSGDRASGTWSGSITLPQGFPPGTYYVKVITWDVDTNMTAYVSAGLPDASSYAHQLDTNPTVTVIDTARP